MNRSSSTNPDGRGRTISGATVVVGLVLLVLAIAGLAVASYLAIGPFSLRRDAAARFVAESSGPASSPAVADEPPAASRAQVAATSPTDSLPDAPPRPETSDASKPLPDGRAPPPPLTGQEAETGLAAAEDSAAEFPLVDLTPLEVVGLGGHAGDWRGPVTIDGRLCQKSLLLQPPTGEDVAQIAFGLQKRFDRLAGVVAIVARDPSNPAGAGPQRPQAVFRLYGDGNLLWESELLAGFGAHRELACQVQGVEVLTLVAESQAAGEGACFAWGDLRLRPAEKKTVPAPGQP